MWRVCTDHKTRVCCVSAGTFSSGSPLVCLYEQNVYTLEPGKVQVRNFQVSLSPQHVTLSAVTDTNDTQQ